MLQIPSSAFSLVSISSKVLFGLCGGFFLGSKVLYTRLVLSIPKNSLSATQTTASIWLPTKCALPTPQISVSCIAIVGYATVVFASLFCILRAKSFPGIASQPPSPPPNSGSSFSADDKRGRSWILWIILIIIGLAVLALALVFWLFVNDGSLPAPIFTVPWIDGLSLMERTFENGLIFTASLLSAARLHIPTPAYQHFNIVLLASASHAVCIALALAFEQWRRRAVSLAPNYWLQCCVTIFVPVIIILSFSWLNWVFWIFWYFEFHFFLPTVTTVAARIIRLPSPLLFLHKYESASVLTIAGSALVHAAIWGLSTIGLALLGVPHAARHVIRCLSRRSVLRLSLRISCAEIIIFVYCFGIIFPGIVFIGSSLEILRLVLWHSVPFTPARAEVQKILWGMVSELLEWKHMQIADFHHLVSTLWGLRFSGINICVRTWGGLAWGHQLLIVVPAMIFYSYFYLVSHLSPSHAEYETCEAADVDDLSFSASFSSPPTRSVENRLSSVSIDGDSDNTTKKIPDDIDNEDPRGRSTSLPRRHPRVS